VTANGGSQGAERGVNLLSMAEKEQSGPALRIEGLRKAFSDVQAVDGLDLEVRRGECFGLLGPNGAGKTTTIEICEGLLEPDAGTVELFGLDWKRFACFAASTAGGWRWRS